MELVHIFSTPVWISELPDFKQHKESFLTSVRNFKKKNPQGEQISNVSGYQSPSTLQKEKELEPLFEHVCNMAMSAIQDLNFVESNIFITEAWVNFNDSRQCMNTEHVHRDVFSGVFYLNAPPESGKFVISNPGINRVWDGCNLIGEKNQFTGEMMRIEPEEGSIILFPSYVPHSVETNNHDDERISISFNIAALPSSKFKELMKQK
jgi:uncharacterized protein (TIGR02466 family)